MSKNDKKKALDMIEKQFCTWEKLDYDSCKVEEEFILRGYIGMAYCLGLISQEERLYWLSLLNE